MDQCVFDKKVECVDADLKLNKDYCRGCSTYRPPQTATEKFILKDSGEREKFKSGMVRDTRTDKGRFDLISPIALRRLAMGYEKGAIKYEARNWEKGSPMSRFMDSALRHLNQYKEGLRDEDHLAQAAWNIFCMIHFEELRPELNDLPVYFSKKT